MKEKLKGFLKPKRILPLLFLAFAIGIGVYNINAKVTMGDRLPMPFGVGVSVVLSGSMEPTIMTDDLVVVTKVKPEDVKEQDIIVYQSGSSMVLHRVLDIYTDPETGRRMMITKGDNPINSEDSPTPLEAVKGKYLFRIGGVGKVVGVLQSPIFTIAVVILAFVLVERSYAGEKKQRSTDLDRIKAEIAALRGEAPPAEEDTPNEDDSQ